MANVSARQKTKPETSAFRAWMRGGLPDGVTFRMSPYKIGQAIAEKDDNECWDFLRAVSYMVGYLNGTDAEFKNYAQGYIDRAIELCADDSEYLVKVKAAYGIGA